MPLGELGKSIAHLTCHPCLGESCPFYKTWRSIYRRSQVSVVIMIVVVIVVVVIKVMVMVIVEVEYVD